MLCGRKYYVCLNAGTAKKDDCAKPHAYICIAHMSY